MSTELQAVYENGVLRPLEPVDLQEHEQVAIIITGQKKKTDKETVREKLKEKGLLIDDEDFHNYCKSKIIRHVTIEEINELTATIPGSWSDDIIKDREDRI